MGAVETDQFSALYVIGQPFRAHCQATPTAGAGWWPIPLDTVDFGAPPDPTGWWLVELLLNGVYTAEGNGYYDVQGQVQAFSGAAGDLVYAGILKDGSIELQGSAVYATAAGQYLGACVQGKVQGVPGTALQLAIYTSSGLPIAGATAQVNYLCVQRCA